MLIQQIQVWSVKEQSTIVRVTHMLFVAVIFSGENWYCFFFIKRIIFIDYFQCSLI